MIDMRDLIEENDDVRGGEKQRKRRDIRSGKGAGVGKHFGVKWKILMYLAAFVAVIIALLWIFLILLLDDIYSAIILRTLYRCSDTIQAQIDKADDMIAESDELDTIATYIAQEHEVCVYVFSFSGKTATTAAKAHVAGSCLIHNIDSDTLAELYVTAKASEDGVSIRKIPMNAFNSAYQGGMQSGERGELELPLDGSLPRSDSSMPDSVIYTKAFTARDGTDTVIFLNCAMTPVASTVSTLRVMLGWISLIMILFAVALAYLISHRVSLPIADVNREAKQLVSCSYNGERVRRGYREIEELNRTLTYAAAELSKVDRLQKELIANISHDLRTPLTLIGGYTEMMRDIPGENSPENMQVVIDETHRLTTLVNDLLEVSRFQTGSQQLSPARFNLTESLRAAICRIMKLYEPDGYTVTLIADPDIEVTADETRILQVIYNLIGNAVNYTGDDKSVTVEQSVYGDTVRVSVADTGEGIAEEDLPLIFDRYYKVDKTHRRGKGGSGLGLSIVKEILILHGARFGVKSELGGGSVFWFELKLAPQTEPTPREYGVMPKDYKA